MCIGNLSYFRTSINLFIPSVKDFNAYCTPCFQIALLKPRILFAGKPEQARARVPCLISDKLPTRHKTCTGHAQVMLLNLASHAPNSWSSSSNSSNISHWPPSDDVVMRKIVAVVGLNDAKASPSYVRDSDMSIHQ